MWGVCIKRKSCRLGKAKRTQQEYIKLHKSNEKMKPKMTDKSIRYAIRQLEKGRDTKTVAKELNVTQRHIQRLWAEYLKTGVIHTQRPAGRPPDLMPSDETIQTVLNTHKNKPEGYVRTAQRLKREGQNISYHHVYRIVLSNDPQYFSSGRWHRIGYKKIDMGPVHSIVSCRYDAPLGCG